MYLVLCYTLTMVVAMIPCAIAMHLSRHPNGDWF